MGFIGTAWGGSQGDFLLMYLSVHQWGRGLPKNKQRKQKREEDSKEKAEIRCLLSRQQRKSA